MRTADRHPVVALLLGIALIGACASSAPSPAPTTPATQSPGVSIGPTSTATTSPSDASLDPFVGHLVVTVTDHLRVRSQPRVSDDSIKYEPLLRLGTTLSVLDGPVSGSGYTWYQVRPVSPIPLDGPGFGWVAMAAKDGEPWIALEVPPADVVLAHSQAARAAADPAAAKTAAASANAFALDLYRALLADPALDLAEKNAIFSPASIAIALGMARAGARDDTASELDTALHTTGWDALGPGLNALDQALASRDATWEGYDGATKALILRIANASFAQQDWSIEPAFLDDIASTFGAGVQQVDYIGDPEGSRRAINQWVSDQTAGRIPQLLQPKNVTDATRLFLVNAMYLRGEWVAKFHREFTQVRSFERLDGSIVKVPTMYQEEALAYATGDGWRATQLDVGGGEQIAPLSVTLILPDDLATFEPKLTAKILDGIIAAVDREADRANDEVACDSMCSCHRYDLKLSLPKFDIETRADLKEPLRRLGVHDAFDAFDADFTGIHVPTAGDSIHIDRVIHQATIGVDEEGCEASAATAIGFDTGGCSGSVPLKAYTLRFDHPFLAVVRDVETGAILFLGRVVDPSVQAG